MAGPVTPMNPHTAVMMGDPTLRANSSLKNPVGEKAFRRLSEYGPFWKVYSLPTNSHQTSMVAAELAPTIHLPVVSLAKDEASKAGNQSRRSVLVGSTHIVRWRARRAAA